MDTKRCPICGGDNECAMAKDTSASECWCYTVEISDEAMQRVPDDAQGKTCICSRCASAEANPS